MPNYNDRFIEDDESNIRFLPQKTVVFISSSGRKFEDLTLDEIKSLNVTKASNLADRRDLDRYFVDRHERSIIIYASMDDALGGIDGQKLV